MNAAESIHQGGIQESSSLRNMMRTVEMLEELPCLSWPHGHCGLLQFPWEDWRIQQLKWELNISSRWKVSLYPLHHHLDPCCRCQGQEQAAAYHPLCRGGIDWNQPPLQDLNTSRDLYTFFFLSLRCFPLTGGCSPSGPVGLINKGRDPHSPWTLTPWSGHITQWTLIANVFIVTVKISYHILYYCLFFYLYLVIRTAGLVCSVSFFPLFIFKHQYPVL